MFSIHAETETICIVVPPTTYVVTAKIANLVTENLTNIASFSSPQTEDTPPPWNGHDYEG